MNIKKSPKAVSGKKRRADPNLERIMELAREIVKLKEICRGQGMFVDDRELLECPYCWLAESVDINGFHLVTLPLDRKKDTGLRFAQIGRSGRRWRCPNCGRGFRGGGEIGADKHASLKTKLKKLQVESACHDIQIQALYEVIRLLREASGSVTMLPAITYPQPHTTKRTGIIDIAK
ncbi:MAG: hypothetical protein HY926_03900 [Elusimicrobia bacterium]|nr:hypothetical protein [Elusimicrobiota bacterium]